MELFDSLWKMIFEFLLFAAIVGGIRRLSISTGRKIQKLATDWPAAHGTVEHAAAKMVGEGRSGYWVGELSYSYSVDGEYFAGVAELPASSEETAWEAVKGWKDRKVTVRYMANSPGKSVLVIDEQGTQVAAPN